jgi:hypothetical protein
MRERKKWFEGHPDIDQGQRLKWGSRAQIDGMLSKYAQADSTGKEEAHQKLVKMWKAKGLTTSAYEEISALDGFRQAFKAAGGQGKRKRSHGGGGRAPARGRGRAPMRGRGASRVKRQKY